RHLPATVETPSGHRAVLACRAGQCAPVLFGGPVPTAAPAVAHPPPAGRAKPDQRRRYVWIDHWEPDNEQFWESRGSRIARKNLIFSIFAEHLGFSIWVLWTVVVINLGNIGITLTLPEQFWLTAIPNLIGSGLRIPYTFAIAKFGGRLWTAMSASLLLIPALL